VDAKRLQVVPYSFGKATDAVQRVPYVVSDLLLAVIIEASQCHVIVLGVEEFAFLLVS
jgi:hypothetical protein